jgi:hypothetical protein
MQLKTNKIDLQPLDTGSLAVVAEAVTPSEEAVIRSSEDAHW